MKKRLILSLVIGLLLVSTPVVSVFSAEYKLATEEDCKLLKNNGFKQECIPGKTLMSDISLSLLGSECRVDGEDPKSFLLKRLNNSSSHVTQLNTGFACCLARFINSGEQSGHKITIYSGYRSPQRQAQLKATKGKWAGSPGGWVGGVCQGSRHNCGIAADLRFNGARIGASLQNCMRNPACKWAHENAQKFGLFFRLLGGCGNSSGKICEPWHIEPISQSKNTTCVASGQQYVVTSNQNQDQATNNLNNAMGDAQNPAELKPELQQPPYSYNANLTPTEEVLPISEQELEAQIRNALQQTSFQQTTRGLSDDNLDASNTDIDIFDQNENYTESYMNDSDGYTQIANESESENYEIENHATEGNQTNNTPIPNRVKKTLLKAYMAGDIQKNQNTTRLTYTLLNGTAEEQEKAAHVLKNIYMQNLGVYNLNALKTESLNNTRTNELFKANTPDAKTFSKTPWELIFSTRKSSETEGILNEINSLFSNQQEIQRISIWSVLWSRIKSWFSGNF